jgi:hypothetical protein
MRGPPRPVRVSPQLSGYLFGSDDYGMRSRVLVWVALMIAAAAAAGLAVDVAIAGTSNATGLAGVIAGFCELAAVVLGIAAWAGERRVAEEGRQAENASSTATADGESTTRAEVPHGEDRKYVVDARGAEGVQVGNSNTQYVISRSASPGRQEPRGKTR